MPREVDWTYGEGGDSVRVIGWSSSLGDLLSLIVVDHETGMFGANGWRANSKDRALYRGEEEEE